MVTSGKFCNVTFVRKRDQRRDQHWVGRGVTAWIGDDYNGRTAKEQFAIDEMGAISDWLDAKAKALYPDSQDVKGTAKPHSNRD
jgi:hypothetical protein